MQKPIEPYERTCPKCKGSGCDECGKEGIILTEEGVHLTRFLWKVVPYIIESEVRKKRKEENRLDQ